MKILAADFVAAEVTDLPAAERFYREVLGLRRLEPDHKTWIEFDVPPTTFAIYAPDERPARIGGAYLGLAVPDFDAAIAELKARGIPFTFGPHESPVCHLAFLNDPSGNTVCIHRRKDGTAG